jgi:hypothetical protein
MPAGQEAAAQTTAAPEEKKKVLRAMPLDLFLVIDGSAQMDKARTDTFAWIDSQIVGQMLQPGDTLTIYSAGETSQELYSGEVTADTTPITAALADLKTSGTAPNFTDALQDAAKGARKSEKNKNRLCFTLLVSGSASGLSNILSGKTAPLLRWSRTESYDRWQALMIAPPGTAAEIHQAALTFMSH